MRTVQQDNPITLSTEVVLYSVDCGFKMKAAEVMATMTGSKECFFISPIGDKGSKERERSNKVIKYIIKEALSKYDYSVTRADQMDEPGSITNQVIQKTTDSELVIADLTGHNPNVFYELAVRHATGNPYIQIIHSSETIPFDINDFRTIKYSLEVEGADKAKNKISEQVRLLEESDQAFNNPISQSAELQSLLSSNDPREQHVAKIIERISRIEHNIDQIKNNTSIKANKSYTETNEISAPNRNKKSVFVHSAKGGPARIPDPVTQSELREFATDNGFDYLDLKSCAERDGVKIVDDDSDIP